MKNTNYDKQMRHLTEQMIDLMVKNNDRLYAAQHKKRNPEHYNHSNVDTFRIVLINRSKLDKNKSGDSKKGRDEPARQGSATSSKTCPRCKGTGKI